MVVAAETALLRRHGHEVMLLEENNDAITGLIASVGAAFRAVYSFDARRRVHSRIERFRPDVVHVHNFFPRFSFSVYDACAESNVPVVQSLHNYRLLCANACFYRNGSVCEACSGKAIGWPGIWNGCYRDSKTGSAAVVAMQSAYRLRKTSTHKVDKYIALTEFARRKFVAAGFPDNKVVRKPNFLLSDPGVGSGQGGYVFFAGRLTAEKGISTLLAAWRLLESNCMLKIVGDGPESLAVSEAAKLANVEWLGRRSSAEVYALMRSASVVVMPSEWYEGFPVVLAEAFASGTPIIASRIGGLAELVDDGRTGLLFSPGNTNALASALEWVFRHPSELLGMRRNARAEYESKYTADQNYSQLMSIYDAAIEERRELRCVA